MREYLGSAMPAGWHIAGTGDFNGDGLTDILWTTNVPGGSAYLWMMTANGPTAVSLAQYGKVPSKAWIGDFNGDGKSDILWDMGSGAPILWTMNGATVSSISYLGSAMPPGWHIAGVGDFNGDGFTDVLWTPNVPGGPAYLWMMSASGPAPVSLAQYGKVPVKAWIGDFNGDGKSDILWDMGSATPLLWTMNGATVASATYLGSAMPAGWHIAGVGDLDGNGLTDVIWRSNLPIGPAYLWMMSASGPTPVSLAQYGNVPATAWTGIFSIKQQLAQASSAATIVNKPVPPILPTAPVVSSLELPCSGAGNQSYTPVLQSDGYYQLQSPSGSNNLCLDAGSGGKNLGTSVSSNTCSSSLSQKWVINLGYNNKLYCVHG